MDFGDPGISSLILESLLDFGFDCELVVVVGVRFALRLSKARGNQDNIEIYLQSSFFLQSDIIETKLG